MAGKSACLAILEKHASNPLMRPVNWYKATKKSPAFKAKKLLGQGMVATGVAGYGLHKVTEDPEPQRVPSGRV